MRQEKFHDALNFLDDDMIGCVVELRNKRRNQRIYWIKTLSAVACVCLILGGILVFGMLRNFYRENLLKNNDFHNAALSGNLGVGKEELLPENGMDKDNPVYGSVGGPDTILLEIVDWMENGFEGKIIENTEEKLLDKIKFFVSFEEGVAIRRWSDAEKKYYEVKEMPKQEEFPIGSKVVVRYGSCEWIRNRATYELYQVDVALKK